MYKTDVENYTDDIFSWFWPIVQSCVQGPMLDAILAEMDVGAIYIVQDWAMKWL